MNRDELPQLLMRLPSLEGVSERGPKTSRERLVERADGEDAAAIGDLLSMAFEEPWDAERVGEELGPAQGVDASYVVRNGSKVIAVASSRRVPEIFPDMGYVHYVATDAAERGRGLGGAVTKAVLLHFASLGLSGAVLETDDFRLPAVRTYLRLGFVPEYRHETDQARWSEILPLVLDGVVPERRVVGA